MNILEFHRYLSKLAGRDLTVVVYGTGNEKDYGPTDGGRVVMKLSSIKDDIEESDTPIDEPFTINIPEKKVIYATRVSYKDFFFPCLDIDSKDYSNLFKAILALTNSNVVRKAAGEIYLYETTKGFHLYITKALDIKYYDAWLKIARPFCDPKFYEQLLKKDAHLRFSSKYGAKTPEFVMVCSHYGMIKV